MQIGTDLVELRKRRVEQDTGLSPANLIHPVMEDNKFARGKKENGLANIPQGQVFQWERPVSPVRWYLVILFIILSLASRFYRIEAGNFVSWDEAHFGKFASYYLKRHFYWDVHPPLGKMLVALGGYLAGYQGDFDFGSGGEYADKVNYVFMRMFVASFGSMIVPLSYITACQLRFSEAASILVGCMTLFENGLIGITRLILLDSMLLCFTAAAFCSYAWFRNLNVQPFTIKWKIAMLCTGFNLGCVSSVKWVGFFITAMIGFMTIEELWNVLNDPRSNKRLLMRHVLSRVVGLIVVPVAVYVFCFYLHFLLLNESGPGDANMNSLFQASLQGSNLSNSPIEVVYGSEITVKSNVRSGGLLHSHRDLYPNGSKQQQVTTYHHKDINNYFIITHPVASLKNYTELEVPINVRHGDIIRLMHKNTGRNLHSHRLAAPLTKGDYEVSTYGSTNHHDENDLWKLEIIKDSRPGEPILRSLTTKFVLKQISTGCYLRSRNHPLPKWGFGQGEVTCDRFADISKAEYQWNIEHHINEKLPAGSTADYKQKFLEDLIDINLGMYRTNNALTQDPEYEPGKLVSNAQDWFFMRRGIRMVGWGDEKTKFYMLGNPAVWWAGSVAIIITFSMLVSFILMTKRQYYYFIPSNRIAIKMTVGAWAMTYLPFFIMGRVLYLHHYYPALIFSTMTVGFLFDFFLYNRRKSLQWVISLISIAVVLGVFIYFSPMCYGIEGSAREVLKGRKWLRSWNIY